MAIEIVSFPINSMVDLSMAMLNKQMAIYLQLFHFKPKRKSKDKQGSQFIFIPSIVFPFKPERNLRTRK
jgi:hypothetical protein